MVEYEYDDASDFGGRVLWARVAVFAVIALCLIFLGRCTKGGGVDEAQLAQVEQERDTLLEANDRLEETVTDLNERIRELTSTGTTGTPAPGQTTGTGVTGTEGTGTTTPTDAATGGSVPVGGSTYVVQPGDTLSGIAGQVYGDPTKFGLIAQANGITDSNPLQVGQSLTIPPNPDQ
jgi:nucleoid-associated protein YgaU